MRMSRFTLRPFRSRAEVLGTRLGPLEQRAMEWLWDHPNSSVRDVCAHLGSGTAYTTIETTLDRLYKKGLLARYKAGRAFLYRPTASREDLERLVAADLVDGLISAGLKTPLPVLSNLVEAVGEQDRELLDELERLVRRKQEELRKRGTP